MHDHALCGLVQACHQLLVNYHFGHDGVNGGLFKRKLVGKRHLRWSKGENHINHMLFQYLKWQFQQPIAITHQGNGVVDLGISEQVSS